MCRLVRFTAIPDLAIRIFTGTLNIVRRADATAIVACWQLGIFKGKILSYY